MCKRTKKTGKNLIAMIVNHDFQEDVYDVLNGYLGVMTKEEILNEFHMQVLKVLAEISDDEEIK